MTSAVTPVTVKTNCELSIMGSPSLNETYNSKSTLAPSNASSGTKALLTSMVNSVAPFTVVFDSGIKSDPS